MGTTATSVAMHWIDGKWADSGEHRDSVNPATGEVIGSYAMGGPREAQAAIEAAKRAFADPSWRTNRLLRARVLNRMADRFEQRADDLVELLGLENGKTHVPTVSFTGSTATGKQISATASDNLKRVGLELGGKTPLILFEDADLDQALPIVVSALIVFSGQFCMAGSRLLVHERIADRVRTELAARLSAVRVGPASDPASEMGPIIDKPNVERIDKIVEDAISQGADVIVRGGPITEGPLAAGAFYRPALLEAHDNSMPVVQNEVFGPVLTMQTFATEAEAIAMANDSEYGLSASVFSRDVDVPLRVALALESGSVWVNDWAKLHDQFEEGASKAAASAARAGSR